MIIKIEYLTNERITIKKLKPNFYNNETIDIYILQTYLDPKLN